MPYLPTTTNAPTTFPPMFGKDYLLQIRMVEEKWTKHFGTIEYHPILVATTPAAAANLPVGEAGTTKWDPLYGEPVDPAMTTLVQPHLSGAYKASDVEAYGPVAYPHLRVNVEASDADLKRWGFEKKEDMIAMGIASELDALGISCKPGDWFPWNEREYVVKKVGSDGRWKNTTAHFYVVLSCETRRIGS